jgi:S1-C subfamily serine protease
VSQLPQLRAQGGVLVAGLLAQSNGGQGNLEAGDVIIAMNGSPVTGLARTSREGGQRATRRRVRPAVQRGQYLVYVVLELE